MQLHLRLADSGDQESRDRHDHWLSPGYVYSVAFSPDGQTLASGSGEKTIKIWRCD